MDPFTRLFTISSSFTAFSAHMFYSIFIAYLLLTVEPNPGPSGPTGIRFGILNARGTNRKGAQIDHIIYDLKLDVLALSETWIDDDAPAAIKYDIAPDNYTVLHTHRQHSTGQRQTKRGGGLALVYSRSLTAKTIHPLWIYLINI